MLSEYLEGELDARDQRRLEAHVERCARCRRVLISLADTVGALGSLKDERPNGLADSIIAAVRAESPRGVAVGNRSESTVGVPALTLVPGASEPAGGRSINRWPQEALRTLRWCLQRAQLRLTVPIAVVAGVVLSMVNMGGTLVHGKIDLGVCLMCVADFLVPFLALNLGLLMVLRAVRGRGLPARDGH